MSNNTFTDRTKHFWNWFTDNEEKMSDMVRNRNDASYGDAEVDFIAEGVALLSESLRFNIGGDHEFTFTVDGNYPLFFLLPYVVANLPEVFQEKWTFFPCMQSTNGHNFTFKMYGKMVDSEKVMVSAIENKEDGTADIHFYAEEWESLADDECYSVFYILMELIIGEALANVFVNMVKRADCVQEDMFPLTRLEQWMLDRFCKEGKVPDPAERYFAYEKKPEDSPLARADIMIGYTKCVPLLGCYDSGDPDIYQTFTRFGAKPVFLYYYYYEDEQTDPNAALEQRNVIMDKLEEEVLGETGSGSEIGMVLGAAMGDRCAYIDLLLYDEQAFVEKAEKLLAEKPAMFFCREFVKDGGEELLTGEHTEGFAGRLQQLGACKAYDKIIEIIEKIPEEHRDDIINSIYARALRSID